MGKKYLVIPFIFLIALMTITNANSKSSQNNLFNLTGLNITQNQLMIHQIEINSLDIKQSSNYSIQSPDNSISISINSFATILSPTSKIIIYNTTSLYNQNTISFLHYGIYTYNITNSSGQQNVSVTLYYPSSLNKSQRNSLAPYIVINGNWVKIKHFHNNNLTNSLTFNSPTDPTDTIGGTGTTDFLNNAGFFDWGANPAIASGNGNLQTLGINISSVSGGGGGFILALYSDSGGSPSTMIDHTANTLISSTGWVDLPVVNHVAITTSTHYWIMVQSSAGSNVNFVTGVSTIYYMIGQTYGTFPTFSGSAGNNDNINVRMTYASTTTSTTSTSTSTTTSTTSTSTSTTTTSTTTSTSTSTSVSTTSTSSTTTTINPIPITSLQMALLQSFGIPFFGYALLILMFGIVFMFGKNIPISFLVTSIFSWILANPSFPLLDIYTATILTIISGSIITYYIFRQRHPK